MGRPFSNTFGCRFLKEFLVEECGSLLFHTFFIKVIGGGGILFLFADNVFELGFLNIAEEG